MSSPSTKPTGLRLLLLAVIGTFLLLLSPPVATAAPFGPYAETLTFAVDDISPQIVTTTSGTTLQIRGTVTNTAAMPVELMNVRFHRGEVLSDRAALQTELTNPSEPLAVVTRPVDLPIPGDSLAPGASMPIDLSVELVDPAGLSLPGPGVYPLLVNINGTLVNGDSRQAARIGELHLVTTVVSLPGQDSTPAVDPLPVTTFRTVSDRPHLGVAGVFLDDTLLTSIAPGGELDRVVTELETAPPGWRPTIVIDPMVVDELDRMSRGYRVVADPAVGQLPLTPDSSAVLPVSPSSATPATTPATTTAPTAPSAALEPLDSTALPGTVAGTGGRQAAAFLGRLQALAEVHDTIALPYGNPDVVAMTAADLSPQITALAAQGRTVTAALLPSRVRTDLAVPPGGWVDQTTVTALRSAGYTSVLVSASTLTDPTSTATVTSLIDSHDQVMPAIVAGAQGTVWWSELLTSGTAEAMALNSAVADLVLGALDGSPQPLVLAGDQRLAPAADTAVQTLAQAGLITGAALPPATPLGPAGTPALPQEQRDQLLSGSFLKRIGAVLGSVAPISAAVEQAPGGPDPAVLFDPLTNVIGTLYAVTNRTDPAPAEQVLRTVQGTLDGVRDGVRIRFNSSYSLASASSPLVFTVQNELPYAARLTVAVTGGGAVGLEVTPVPDQLFPPNRTESVILESHVARSGAFSVNVGLVTAQGAAWSAAQSITVTSSAYGLVTILIIVVAGVVLVVMVGFRIAQRVKGRKARLAAESSAESNPDAAQTSDTEQEPAPKPDAQDAQTDAAEESR